MVVAAFDDGDACVWGGLTLEAGDENAVPGPSPPSPSPALFRFFRCRFSGRTARVEEVAEEVTGAVSGEAGFSHSGRGFGSALVILSAGIAAAPAAADVGSRRPAAAAVAGLRCCGGVGSEGVLATHRPAPPLACRTRPGPPPPPPLPPVVVGRRVWRCGVRPAGTAPTGAGDDDKDDADAFCCCLCCCSGVAVGVAARGVLGVRGASSGAFTVLLAAAACRPVTRVVPLCIVPLLRLVTLMLLVFSGLPTGPPLLPVSRGWGAYIIIQPSAGLPRGLLPRRPRCCCCLSRGTAVTADVAAVRMPGSDRCRSGLGDWRWCCGSGGTRRGPGSGPLDSLRAAGAVVELPAAARGKGDHAGAAGASSRRELDPTILPPPLPPPPSRPPVATDGTPLRDCGCPAALLGRLAGGRRAETDRGPEPPPPA